MKLSYTNRPEVTLTMAGWIVTILFSFAGFYDPAKVHFGALRVLNDDSVKAGSRFRKHPQYNMEIVSIPLYGDLEHRDSTGRHEIIRQNDVYKS